MLTRVHGVNSKVNSGRRTQPITPVLPPWGVMMLAESPKPVMAGVTRVNRRGYTRRRVVDVFLDPGSIPGGYTMAG